jgi:hypothetical protein
MTRVLILACATLLAATVASAQAPPVRAIQIQPIQAQPAPATQAIQVQPAATASDAAQVAPAEPIGPVQTPEALAAANQQLRENNRLLRNENSALKDRILQMTTRGGSQVRAWCPTETTSRNTAGAEADCGATGYKCEDVSGLCHKTCTSSDQCAVGHSCNPCNNHCENNAGPITQC